MSPPIQLQRFEPCIRCHWWWIRMNGGRDHIVIVVNVLNVPSPSPNPVHVGLLETPNAIVLAGRVHPVVVGKHRQPIGIPRRGHVPTKDVLSRTDQFDEVQWFLVLSNAFDAEGRVPWNYVAFEHGQNTIEVHVVEVAGSEDMLPLRNASKANAIQNTGADVHAITTQRWSGDQGGENRYEQHCGFKETENHCWEFILFKTN